MLDPFYKSFYLFLIFYSICLDPTGYIHRIRMKEANGICYIVYRQAPCNKEGLCEVLGFEFLPVKGLPTSCYRSIKEQIIGTGPRKSCIFPPLEQRESFVGEGLARWFHPSVHALVSGPSPQLGKLAPLLLFVVIQNTDFLNPLWNACSQLPSLLQRDLPFAWCKDKTNVVRTGLNSGLDGFRSGQSANFNLCQSATPLLFQPHCLPS